MKKVTLVYIFLLSCVDLNAKLFCEVLNEMIAAATQYTTEAGHTDCLTYAQASLISGSLLETLKKLKING